MPQVVENCAVEAGWKRIDGEWTRLIEKDKNEKRTHRMRGLGFTCGYKNIGFSFGYQENCSATVELYGDSKIERVVVRHSAAEVGQGTHTAIVQMVADATNVAIEQVEWDFSDTASSRNSGSASASRMTFMAGNSIQGAVNAALKRWKNEDRPAKATYKYLAPKTTPLDPNTGYSKANFAYGYVAQAVELEVDTQTGLIHIINVVSTNDVGRAINPQQVVGQTEGAIVQAVGYSILENFQQENGYVKNPHLSTYLIPTVLDIPDHIETIIIENPDPNGPWGARGMGEMPFIPLAPAITAAVHDAVGVWFDEFPLTPERVLRGLERI